MTKDDFNEVVARRQELIGQVLASKGKEYANSNDVFHNFKNATGLSFHNAAEKVAWEFMVKHLQSIKDIIAEVSSETKAKVASSNIIEEKIGDAINYLILIEGMLKERSNNYKSARG